MSAMAIYRQLRRLPTNWRLGLLAVSRRFGRHRPIYAHKGVIGTELPGLFCLRQGCGPLARDSDFSVELQQGAAC